ncbi:MAG: hypothetical protein K0U45_09930 [Alphaproteobacteria bacterium]|nr:hypothetical protein [Alphaproteobacteria bacterium]
MIYNLPELDRMSRALSRLETALLTKRTALPLSGNVPKHLQNNSHENAASATDLAQENQMLRLQCQEMREQLQQAHSLLAEILGHQTNIDEQNAPENISQQNPSAPYDIKKLVASADKIKLHDLRNDDDEEHNG